MRRRSNFWEDPPMYIMTKGGEFVRIPYEELKPIDPTRLTYTFDYASLERRIMEKK